MMQDLSRMSDEELLRALGRAPSSTPAAAASMSDDDLLRALGPSPQTRARQPTQQSWEDIPNDDVPYNPALSSNAITGDDSPEEIARKLGQAPGSAPAGSPHVWSDLTDEQRMGLGRGDQVQIPNGEVVTLRGSPFVDQNIRATDRQVDGLNLREPNLQDQIGAFSSAYTEQIPFGDELVARGTSLASGRSYEDLRRQQMSNREVLNQTNRNERVAGGLGGFATGLMAPGAGMVARGATGLNRAARAGGLGAGYGALYGAGATETGGNRVEGAVSGGLIGAASGGLAQAGVDRFAGLAQRARTNPSPARQLSRMGVELTPGQMLENVAVVGPMLRSAEDAVSGIPFAGSAVQGARNQGIESFNRVAINRALAPINQSLPKGMNGGYEAVAEAQRRLGQAYDDVLPHVSAQLDRPLYDEIAGVLDRAASEMPEPMVQQLGRILQGRVFRGIDDATATMSGSQFKRVESELGALAREYRLAPDPSAKSLGYAIGDIQNALRNMVARQNPFEARRIQQINEGYANLTRIERAAGSGPAMANEGMFTPTQLGEAVRSMDRSRSAGGSGRRLMQDLASAGRAVLPNKVGDSGTATRGAMTALLAGGASGAVSPALAVPVVGASLAYSRPAQAALNTIYRATDRPGAVNGALSDLARLAGQNPALVPYYEAALLRSQLSSLNPALERRREARGLFGTRGLQTAQR